MGGKKFEVDGLQPVCPSPFQSQYNKWIIHIEPGVIKWKLLIQFLNCYHNLTRRSRFDTTVPFKYYFLQIIVMMMVMTKCNIGCV